MTDEELTRIYKQANGETTGKAQPLTTQRIFKAMRAMIDVHQAKTAQGASGDTAPAVQSPTKTPSVPQTDEVPQNEKTNETSADACIQAPLVGHTVQPRVAVLAEVNCTCAGYIDGWHSKTCAKRR